MKDGLIYTCIRCGASVSIETDALTNQSALRCKCDEEVYNYFLDRYYDQEIRVAAGHWPKFRTKEEIDTWLECLAIGAKAINNKDRGDQNE